MYIRVVLSPLRPSQKSYRIRDTYFEGGATKLGKHSFRVLLCLLVACSVRLIASFLGLATRHKMGSIPSFPSVLWGQESGENVRLLAGSLEEGGLAGVALDIFCCFVLFPPGSVCCDFVCSSAS